MKIGPHILQQDDNSSSVALISIIASHQQLCSLLSGAKQDGLLDTYKSLGPDNNSPSGLQDATALERLVISYQRLLLNEMPVKNEIINTWVDDYTVEEQHYEHMINIVIPLAGFALLLLLMIVFCI